MASGNVVKKATFGTMKFFIYELFQNNEEGSIFVEKSNFELDISTDSLDTAQTIANQYLVLKGIRGFAILAHLDRDEGGISL